MSPIVTYIEFVKTEHRVQECNHNEEGVDDMKANVKEATTAVKEPEELVLYLDGTGTEQSNQLFLKEAEAASNPKRCSSFEKQVPNLSGPETI